MAAHFSVVAALSLGLALCLAQTDRAAAEAPAVAQAAPAGVWPLERLGRTPSSPARKWGVKWGTIEYGYKVEHCAISAEELARTIAKVVPGHPRLLLRPEPWDGGLGLAQLRERITKQPWAKTFAALAKSAAADARKAVETNKPLNYYSGRNVALYYLCSGDETVVPAVYEYVLSAKPAYNCGGGLLPTCEAYDWIANSTSLSAEQRKQMRDHIAATAFQCAAVQESAFAFDILHHRGDGGWMSDALVAGLALYGEHPDAEKLLRWAVGYFQKNFFQAWRRLGGRYSDYYAGSNVLPQAYACWASAVIEPNVYEVIRRDWGDFLQGHMYFMMAEHLPSRTISAPTAGFQHSQVGDHSSPANYMATGRGYANPDAYAYLRWLGAGRRGAVDPVQDILLYDERTDAKKPWFSTDPPLTWLWGRDGNGYVQMRSKGWAPDSTVVEFKCGDYFWSHDLNCNNNSFYIYHKGHLAVQSGVYDDYYRGEHTANYYPRTVASNSMLVFQPGESWWNRDNLSAFGGQRIPYMGGSSNFTYDEYLSRLDAKHHYEMGEIAAFEHAADLSWSYVCGDATDSYNNPKYADKSGDHQNTPKIDLFTRSLVYLPGSNDLVVFDRVNALDPTYRKTWLLHSVGRPEISGKMLEAEVPGHIETFDGDTVEITWSGGIIPPPDPKDPGRLFVQTFLPKQHTTKRVGGEGYEFYVAGANRPVLRYTGCLKPGTPHPIEAGNWRIEVSPTQPAKFDNFLHLIHICDTKTTAAPKADLIATADEKMLGLHVANWSILFGRRGRVEGPISFTAPPQPTECLLVDLPPGARYAASGPTVVGKGLTASKEGVLRFNTARGGTVTLSPVE